MLLRFVAGILNSWDDADPMPGMVDIGVICARKSVGGSIADELSVLQVDLGYFNQTNDCRRSVGIQSVMFTSTVTQCLRINPFSEPHPVTPRELISKVMFTSCVAGNSPAVSESGRGEIPS
jgi:hypothetical protein